MSSADKTKTMSSGQRNWYWKQNCGANDSNLYINNNKINNEAETMPTNVCPPCDTCKRLKKQTTLQRNTVLELMRRKTASPQRKTGRTEQGPTKRQPKNCN